MTKREAVERANKVESQEERLHTLMQNLFSTLKPGSQAWQWAMALAEILNQTIPCDRCDGTGTVLRHQNCNHTSEYAALWGCNNRIECRKCHGSTRLFIAKDGAK